MRRLYSLALLLIATAAFAQTPWTGILNTARGANWSNAGSPHINDTRTQCGSTVPSTASAATINSDLAACAANTYLLLGAGTFTLTGNITFGSNNNVTLRGSGANSTFLTWSSMSNLGGYCSDGSGRVEAICAASTDNNWVGGNSNTATWSAGYSQGATSITLSNTSNLVVGNPLILDQIDLQTDNSAMYPGCEFSDGSTYCYTGTAPNGFERGYSGPITTIRGQAQVVTVTSIAGSTVGITPGLYAPNWASGNSPGAWWPTSPRLNDGVENLSLAIPSSDVGITFYNCDGCWVKGVRAYVASGTTSTAWCHVCVSISTRVTVRDSYFYGAPGDTYGVEPQLASDMLVENNIFQYYIATMIPNSDCEGCVYGYNFQPGTWGASNTYMTQNHEPHGLTLYFLNEGNIGTGIDFDSFHGTHNLNTAFRNRWDGNEQVNGSNVVNNNNNIPIRIQPATRYENFVANVLGNVGYHTTYKGNSSNYSKSIISCGVYPEEMGSTQDPLSCPTSLFWGNWDVVSNATRWCGNSSDTGWSTVCGSASEVPTTATGYPNSIPTLGDTGAGMGALPASFYYSSKPSWWPSGKAWPIIGPDVTGGNVGQCSGGTYTLLESNNAALCTGGTMTANAMVISNPAMDCYLTTMGGAINGVGGPYTFNPTTCYSSSLISTTTTLTSSNSTPLTGSNITLTASVTPASGPTGTVEFFLGGSPISGCTAVALSSGSATCPITGITAGAHTYTATYSGDTSYATSTSSPITVTAITAPAQIGGHVVLGGSSKL